MTSPSPKRPCEERIGRYEIERELSRGKASRVLKAGDPQTGRTVAIKLLAQDLPDGGAALDALKREAANLALLDHPNIAGVLETGHTQDGRPFLVMEYVDGPSLENLIRSKTRLPFSAMIALAVQSCKGLQAAYRKQIAHLDIKPGNLMVEARSQTLRIVDFGLARQLWRPGAQIPGMQGTPRYMSPEQCRGIGVDHRSDIYSLGATFYHLFAAQPPFEAATDLELIQQRPTARLVPLQEIHPDVPQDVCDIISRMMASDPNDRYQDYDPLIVDLEAAEMAQRAREKDEGLRMKYEPADRPTRGLRNQPTGGLANRRTVQIVLVALAAFLFFLAGTALALKYLHSHSGADSTGISKNAAANRNRLRMRRFAGAVGTYFSNYRQVPSQPAELRKAGLNPVEDTLDAWGHPFTVVPQSRVVQSAGADGQFGTQDDWEITFTRRFTRTPPKSAKP
jgi:predicted Ser/Thr protein kinase